MESNIQAISVISLILFILICAILVRLLKRDKFPYDKTESLVTNTEKIFLNVLLSVIEEDLYILTKVRLADIVHVRKGTKDYLKYFARIQSKHIDFLICDSSTFEPLLAIELDDPSHRREDAKERDEVKDKVLAAAGIPILRVPTQKQYDSRDLINNILELI